MKQRLIEAVVPAAHDAHLRANSRRNGSRSITQARTSIRKPQSHIKRPSIPLITQRAFLFAHDNPPVNVIRRVAPRIGLGRGEEHRGRTVFLIDERPLQPRDFPLAARLERHAPR